MALKSYAQQNPYVNPPTNSIKEQDELAGIQDPAKRSNIKINKALTSLEVPTSLFGSLPTNNLFT